MCVGKYTIYIHIPRIWGRQPLSSIHTRCLTRPVHNPQIQSFMYEEFGDSSIIAFHCSIYADGLWMHSMRCVKLDSHFLLSKGNVRLGKTQAKTWNQHLGPRKLMLGLGTITSYFLAPSCMKQILNLETAWQFLSHCLQCIVWYNDTIGVFTRYLALHNLMTIASAVLAAVSMHKYPKKLKLHKLTIRSPSPLKP